MDHYGCVAQRTNARCVCEDGDDKSQNGHIKDRIDQTLLLRGSRDFVSRDEYMSFVQEISTTPTRLASSGLQKNGRSLVDFPMFALMPMTNAKASV